MTRNRLALAGAVLVVASGLGAGCGGALDGGVRDEGNVATTPPAIAPGSATTAAPPSAWRVKVYFIGSGFVVPGERSVSAGLPAAANEALERLLAGTTPAEAANGLTTALPPDVTVLDATVSDGTARIGLAGSLDTASSESGSATVRLLQLAQIVWTLTDLPGVSSVLVDLNGKPWGLGDLNGGSYTGPLTRELLIAMPASATESSCAESAAPVASDDVGPAADPAAAAPVLELHEPGEGELFTVDELPRLEGSLSGVAPGAVIQVQMIVEGEVLRSEQLDCNGRFTHEMAIPYGTEGPVELRVVVSGNGEPGTVLGSRTIRVEPPAAGEQLPDTPRGGAATQAGFVWLVSQDALVPLPRVVALGDAAPDDLLKALLRGPSAEEQAAGITTALEGVRVLDVEREGSGTVVVRLARDGIEPAGLQAFDPAQPYGTRQALQLAQIVFSLTGLPDVRRVEVEVGGEPWGLVRDGDEPPYEVSSGPFDRDDIKRWLSEHGS